MANDLLTSLFDLIEPRPLTVSELNAEVRVAIERDFSHVWVEGEVVDFKQYGKGQWYFNLNDGDASIKCVCWATTAARIRFRPENGITVRVRGRVTFWEARGELKLTIDSLEPSGEGALAAAYEQIHKRLAGEGLFASEIKRPIPFFPRRVGVVTSKSGAAFHDIVTVLTRRAQSVSIVLAHSLVQGEGAADSIRRAVTALNKYNASLAVHERIDVLIVGRGGGSAEDLWAFNDEALARAIRTSKIPVISAVGHEVDVTIADLVADMRAATPSAAAELVAAREEDIFATFSMGEERLLDLIDRKLYEVAAAAGTADDRLESAFSNTVRDARERLANVSARLTPATLAAQATKLDHTLMLLAARNATAMNDLSKSKGDALSLAVAKLDALSPLGVLSRGYSITQTDKGRVLRDSTDAAKGDKLKIRLEKGTLDAEVI